MPSYYVHVTGEVDHTFTVDAEDEYDAQAAAEAMFFETFTCMSNGYDVGFDSVSAWDAEEING